MENYGTTRKFELEGDPEQQDQLTTWFGCLEPEHWNQERDKAISSVNEASMTPHTRNSLYLVSSQRDAQVRSIIVQSRLDGEIKILEPKERRREVIQKFHSNVYDNPAQVNGNGQPRAKQSFIKLMKEAIDGEKAKMVGYTQGESTGLESTAGTAELASKNSSGKIQAPCTAISLRYQGTRSL
ncbi:uncharacterized protein L3040_000728 [Drepanopeziza brunnea f. sp. 'multigermtubi']|uniref:uncharacterized protein n=1 Tax=Drepanopeziza brunnea f. sp. 'multigermtubi' TaxID=698441 RepID=UPI0023868846|nr:hypothetical protein L3040_000728 [Drepanopeziza brunnea f. sp. 'multigermtubi']